MWALIILVLGGVGATPALTQVQFSSFDRCHEASLIVRKSFNYSSRHDEVMVACVRTK